MAAQISVSDAPQDLRSDDAFSPSEEKCSAKPFRSVHPAAAWLVAGAIPLLLTLITAAECSSIGHWPSLRYGLVFWGWWGCVAGMLWPALRRWPFTLRLSPGSFALHVLLALGLGTLHLLLLGSLYFFTPGWEKEISAGAAWISYFSVNRLGLELLIYTVLLGVAIAMYQNLRSRQERIRTLELERQLSGAQLHALQMQLEPHFLFNTLNAITALVELNRQPEATTMLRNLNSMLQGTLRHKTPERVPLAQELTLLESYLAIEQVRFADRLQVEVSVDPSALNGLVPCFLLQPILENALKHGIAQVEANGLVRTRIQRRGDVLTLSVKDNGPGTGVTATAGHGIGLRNIENRLLHFYKDRYQMTIDQPANGGYEVVITIPFEAART